MKSIKKLAKKLPVFPTLYRKMRDHRLANRQAVDTPLGFKFIGTDDMRSGAFEGEDVKIFQTLLPYAETVVDIGAHAGYYCMQSLLAGKHTIAFEPMPLNMKMLLRNIEINGFEDNAEVFQMALADRPGIAKMYGSGTGSSLLKGWADFSGNTSILVPVSSVDVVVGDRLPGQRLLVVIDTEGVEYEVLKGAEKLLAADPKPMWMVEIVLAGNHPTGEKINPNFIPTFELFWRHGYDAYVWADGGIREIDPENLHANSGEEIAGARSNFLFIHRAAEQAREDVLRLTDAAA